MLIEKVTFSEIKDFKAIVLLKQRVLKVLSINKIIILLINYLIVMMRCNLSLKI